MKNFGFYTGALEIKPYLSRDEIAKDAQAELIPDIYRRPGKSYYIIPTEQVEPYYKSKGLPISVIDRKLKELRLKIG
jgi:hypothetical protein